MKLTMMWLYGDDDDNNNDDDDNENDMRNDDDNDDGAILKNSLEDSGLCGPGFDTTT